MEHLIGRKTFLASNVLPRKVISRLLLQLESFKIVPDYRSTLFNSEKSSVTPNFHLSFGNEVGEYKIKVYSKNILQEIFFNIVLNYGFNCNLIFFYFC